MKSVVLLSGGIDSAVLLSHALFRGVEPMPFGVNYGQRHARELEAAKDICAELKLRYHIADISGLNWLFTGSALTDELVNVPEGPSPSTIVPNRNMIMLALATAYAQANDAEEVAFAVNSGDHEVFPDCRAGFVQAMGTAIARAADRGISLFSPFTSMSKADVIASGAKLAVRFDLTWSCYNGGDLHCGKCGACVARIGAFRVACVQDPTRYLAPGSLADLAEEQLKNWPAVAWKPDWHPYYWMGQRDAARQLKGPS